MSTPGPENLPTGLGHSGRPVDPADADSAGVPWQGRNLPPGDFSGDGGEADAELARALREGGEADVVRHLAGARVFVPMTALEVETTTSESGLEADKQADMAVVLLKNPDGRTALPIFSSLADLQAFDKSLRPVPVRAEDAARSAIGEQAHLMVLDCASEQAFEVRGSMVWALAQGREWAVAHEDEVVRDAVAQVCSQYSEITEVAVGPGPQDGSGVLQVTLTLAPGFDQAGIEALVSTVAEELAAQDEVRSRIAGLGFTIT